jgi:hypothetical protein
MFFDLRLLRTKALALFVGAAFGSVVAAADPGDHIQLGKSTELIPRLDIGLQGRSNLTQSPNNPVGGVSVIVSPGLRLQHQTPDSLVTIDGHYLLVKFFTPRLSGLDQFNDFGVNFDSAFFRSRPFGVVLSNRTALVNNNATDRVGNTPFVTRTRNDLSGGFQIRPGPIFQMDLRGAYEFDNFRVPLGAFAADLRGLNTRHGYGGRWDLEYRFFPRTALVVEGNATRYNWQRNALDRGDAGSAVAVPDSTHVKVLTGLRGRFTDKIVAVAQVGYGSARYSAASVETDCGTRPGCDPEADNFGAKMSALERILLVGQVTYEFMENRRIVLGYRKDFDDVFFTNYMAYHMVSLGTDLKIAQRFRLQGSGALRAEAYRGTIERNDLFVLARTDLTYQLFDWFGITAGGAYMQRNVPLDPAISFNDVQGRLLLNLTY